MPCRTLVSFALEQEGHQRHRCPLHEGQITCSRHRKMCHAMYLSILTFSPFIRESASRLIGCLGLVWKNGLSWMWTRTGGKVYVSHGLAVQPCLRWRIHSWRWSRSCGSPGRSSSRTYKIKHLGKDWTAAIRNFICSDPWRHGGLHHRILSKDTWSRSVLVKGIQVLLLHVVSTSLSRVLLVNECSLKGWCEQLWFNSSD